MMDVTWKKRTSKAGVKVVERPESAKKDLILPGILEGLGVGESVAPGLGPAGAHAASVAMTRAPMPMPRAPDLMRS